MSSSAASDASDASDTNDRDDNRHDRHRSRKGRRTHQRRPSAKRGRGDEHSSSPQRGHRHHRPRVAYDKRRAESSRSGSFSRSRSPKVKKAHSDKSVRDKGVKKTKAVASVRKGNRSPSMSRSRSPRSDVGDESDVGVRRQREVKSKKRSRKTSSRQRDDEERSSRSSDTDAGDVSDVAPKKDKNNGGQSTKAKSGTTAAAVTRGTPSNAAITGAKSDARVPPVEARNKVLDSKASMSRADETIGLKQDRVKGGTEDADRNTRKEDDDNESKRSKERKVSTAAAIVETKNKRKRSRSTSPSAHEKKRRGDSAAKSSDTTVLQHAKRAKVDNESSSPVLAAGMTSVPTGAQKDANTSDDSKRRPSTTLTAVLAKRTEAKPAGKATTSAVHATPVPVDKVTANKAPASSSSEVVASKTSGTTSVNMRVAEKKKEEEASSKAVAAPVHKTTTSGQAGDGKQAGDKKKGVEKSTVSRTAGVAVASEADGKVATNSNSTKSVANVPVTSVTANKIAEGTSKPKTVSEEVTTTLPMLPMLPPLPSRSAAVVSSSVAAATKTNVSHMAVPVQESISSTSKPTSKPVVSLSSSPPTLPTTTSAKAAVSQQSVAAPSGSSGRTSNKDVTAAAAVNMPSANVPNSGGTVKESKEQVKTLVDKVLNGSTAVANSTSASIVAPPPLSHTITVTSSDPIHGLSDFKGRTNLLYAMISHATSGILSSLHTSETLLGGYYLVFEYKAIAASETLESIAQQLLDLGIFARFDGGFQPSAVGQFICAYLTPTMIHAWLLTNLANFQSMMKRLISMSNNASGSGAASGGISERVCNIRDKVSTEIGHTLDNLLKALHNGITNSSLDDLLSTKADSLSSSLTLPNSSPPSSNSLMSPQSTSLLRGFFNCKEWKWGLCTLVSIHGGWLLSSLTKLKEEVAAGIVISTATTAAAGNNIEKAANWDKMVERGSGPELTRRLGEVLRANEILSSTSDTWAARQHEETTQALHMISFPANEVYEDISLSSAPGGRKLTLRTWRSLLFTMAVMIRQYCLLTGSI